jgi:capsular exopolysaccharide synthesis family protein
MEEEHFEEQLDLKKEFFKYLSYWKLFVVSAVIALACVTIYLRYTSPVYVIESKIKILEENNKGLKLPSELLGLMASKSGLNMENEVEVVKSKKLFGKVVADLNLTTNYFYQGKFKTQVLWNAPVIITSLAHKDSLFGSQTFDIQVKKNGYQLTTRDGNVLIIKGSHVKTRLGTVDLLIEPNPNYTKTVTEKKIGIQIMPFKIAVQQLIGKISVEKVGKESEILSVKAQDVNIERSITIIDKIIEVFNDDGINDKRLINQKTVEFIDDRFKFLTQELDSIENEKKNFKQSKNMSFIEADAGVDISKKAVSDQTLFELETQIELSNLLKDAINSKKSAVLPSNIGVNNVIINQLVGQYNTLLLQRDRLLKTAGAENPVLTGLDSQIGEVKFNINESILSYNRQLKISLNQQQLNYSKSKGLVAEIPTNEKILRAIERQQKIKENLYLLLLQKREESAIAYAVTSPSIKIVDYANSSLSPIAPKKNILYLMALSIGLLLPFGGIYLYFLFHTKVKDKKETAFLKSTIPVIAEIPEFEEFKLFSDKNDRSVQAEAFRLLASNVTFSLPLKEENKGQVILVTSSIMGEGKTFISANLSLALASNNKKVLLVGADLRKPKLNTTLDMENVEIGLSSYLHNKEVDWRDVLTKNNPYNEKMDILFSGYIPPNPSNIISNGRFEKLISEATLEYDYIIIDSAPTIYVSDTFIISKVADVTLYITRYDYTERELIAYAKTLKDDAKLLNMVFILNAISDSVGNLYKYNYKYSYNYGYGYGYGENETIKHKIRFFKHPLKYIVQLLKK